MDYKISLIGTTTAIITKTTTAPLDRMKILYQIQYVKNPNKYGSIFETVKTICKEEGIRGLYKGNLVNSLRCVPSYSLKFMFNDYYKKIFNHQNSFSSLLGIGILSGVSQITCTYPFDMLRTRYAMSETKESIPKYTKHIIKTEGLRGLYKGLSVSMLTGSLHVGIQMSTYDVYQEMFDTSNIRYKLLAGSMAGVSAGWITYPGDIIKKRLHVNGVLGEPKIYKNTLNCIKTMYKKEGLRGFYKGIGVCTMKTIPSAAIQFTVFDTLKKYIKT